MKKQLLYFLYLTSFVLLFFGFIEMGLNYFLNHPDKCPKRWVKDLKQYYKYHNTNNIQLDNKMARYDSTLFYTLKPGQFIFKNREFYTPFSVNSAGCRDDEASLDYPKIIVLGDSYTMGWGVNQDETFPQILERNLNVKVLNTGISSYGTPREVELLNRIKTDSMQYLIIQYCDNDFREIVDYVRNGNKLNVSSKIIYDSIASMVSDKNLYYPFKSTFELLPQLLRKPPIKELPKKPKKTSSINVYKGFLDVIRQSKKIPSHTKIYIFTLGVRGFQNHFLENVQNTLEKEYGSSLHDRITFLNFSDMLSGEDYFILDEHVQAPAYQMIADSLTKHIRKEGKGISEKKWYYENGNMSIHANYFDHYKTGVNYILLAQW